MCQIHPSFQKPPPKRWDPELGEEVRLAYGGQTFVVTITQILETPRAYVVTGEDLILPVSCSRDSLRPITH